MLKQGQIELPGALVSKLTTKRESMKFCRAVMTFWLIVRWTELMIVVRKASVTLLCHTFWTILWTLLLIRVLRVLMDKRKSG